jgi:hypothetical protein
MPQFQTSHQYGLIYIYIIQYNIYIYTSHYSPSHIKYVPTIFDQPVFQLLSPIPWPKSTPERPEVFLMLILLRKFVLEWQVQAEKPQFSHWKHRKNVNREPKKRWLVCVLLNRGRRHFLMVDVIIFSIQIDIKKGCLSPFPLGTVQGQIL